MINKRDFKKIQEDLKRFEAEKDKRLHDSREIIKLSKQIIFAVHRDDLKKASLYAKQIKNRFKKFNGPPYNVDLHKTAVQEYVEAIAYFEFVKNSKLPTKSELKVDSECYLLGLCDLTGELVRKAANEIINKDFDEAFKIRNFVNDLYGEFLQLDIRSGELRKKADAVRWNLKKLDDVIFDVRIRRH